MAKINVWSQYFQACLLFSSCFVIKLFYVGCIDFMLDALWMYISFYSHVTWHQSILKLFFKKKIGMFSRFLTFCHGPKNMGYQAMRRKNMLYFNDHTHPVQTLLHHDRLYYELQICHSAFGLSRTLRWVTVPQNRGSAIKLQSGLKTTK